METPIDVELALYYCPVMRERLRWAESFMNLSFFGYATATLAAYVVIARATYYFGSLHHFIPLVWPPAGIGLAAAVLGGYPFAAVIALGALISSLMVHESIGLAISFALGSGLGVAVGRALLDQIRFDPMLTRLTDTLGLAFSAILASLVSSIATSIALYLEHAIKAGTEFDDAWIARWISTGLGMLVVTPFLVRWLPHPLFRIKRSINQLLDFYVSLGALAALDFLTYWSSYTSLGPLPTFYLTLIPLMWIALRVGPRAMTLAIFLNGGIALSGILFGSHNLTNFVGTLLPLQILLGTISILFLILVGLEEERKEVRVKLQTHIGQLEEALQRINFEDKSKNEFIAILAHELRNPLAPVLSALELLKFEEPKLERMRMIESAEEQVKIMRRLLDDLLDIARMTQKKFRLQREPSVLQGAIEQSVHMVEPFMKARNHTFTTSMPEESLWLFADPARLTQIFSNLLFNAAKYTKPGGKIELSVAHEDSSVKVRVRDNGVGIRSEMLTQIFEPFIQFHQHAGLGSGLGLGLSLTRRLVEMHGGTIEAHSAGLGRGSEFIVVLPLSRRVSTLPLPVSSAFPNKKSQQMRILVVDDNEPAAIGLAKLLEVRGGHTVATAHSGKNAIEKTAQFNPQVVVLDIGLPDKDGYTVAKELRQERGQTLKLIALTGYGQEEDKHRAREAGFDYHLTKPVGFAEVERILQRLTLGPEEDTGPFPALQASPKHAS